MNRQQFLAELSQYLTFFSPEERANVIAAYNEKFDAAGQENEYSLIAELGTPMMTAIDLKRRMESGEKIALACEPEATQPEALSEYSVETETEASLVAIAEIQEATPVEAELAEPVTAVSEEASEEAPPKPIIEPQQLEYTTEPREKNKPSRKISVAGIIGASLLSLVITAVFLAVAGVGIILLVAMSYLLLTGLKNLLYITDALLLFGGGLLCAGLGLLIIWFAVSSAVSLVSGLFRKALGIVSVKECDA
ncbi:MAG: DUF1700 domain-containing protein [Oscillospiraceae bacterium]|nr:DUF1700 domain-containing protein [Oscillospiraceae bacterium]